MITIQDLRSSFQRLAARPAFTSVVVAVLALGIGADLAFFSLAQALLSDPPPGVEEPDRMVLLGRVQDGEGFDTFGWPPYGEFAVGVPALEHLAAFSDRPLTLATDGGAQPANTALVTGNYFAALGVPAVAGRTLLPTDAQAPGDGPVAVLAHATAEQLFGSPTSAVGRTVRVNGVPLDVVGVAPEGFRGHHPLGSYQVWVPITQQPRLFPPTDHGLFDNRASTWLSLLGRLADGATVEEAQTQAATVAARLRTEWPEAQRGKDVAVSPGLTHPGLGDYLRRILNPIQGAVALLLLVACANVAGLLLVRAAERQREMGIRLALGSGRGRLMGLVLAESLLLALLGASAGVLLAAWGGEPASRLLSAAGLGGWLDVVQPRVAGSVLAVASGLALLTGLVAGAVPAWAAARPRILGLLQRSSGTTTGGSSRGRDALVVVQLALSLVLLTACGYQLRSLAYLASVDPGFDGDRVLVGEIQMGTQSYDEVQGLQFYDQLAERVAALPGVEHASLGLPVPLSGSRMSALAAIEGWEPPPNPDGSPRDGFELDLRMVTPDYFATLGLPLLQGRTFTAADRQGTPGVAVVGQALADRFWPGGDAVGQFLRVERGTKTLEIVGVVADMKYLNLAEEPRLHFYHPMAQRFVPRTALHVRTAPGRDPKALLPAVREIVTDLDADLPLTDPRTLEEQIRRATGRSRFAATLTSLFAVLAVTLAALGLYGAFAFTVRQRRREIGIRMALGARARRIERLLLGQAARRIASGLACGLVAAIAASRWLVGDLPGVSGTDPWILLGAPGVLVSAALLATWIPAWRASRIDPAVVLKGE